MEFAISERPCSLDTLAGNKSVKEQFSNFFERGTLPHKLLLTGSSGTGKTTLCGIIQKFLQVNESFNLHYIDCGAQKDVATARETVKIMSQSAVGGSSQNVLFILEEVHRLNKNVQEVYLPSLESLKENQYVIATTDQPETLIDTFRSRYMEVKMKPLTVEESYNELLLPIVNKYEIRIKKSTLNKITYMAKGNNRLALSMLTSIAEVPPEMHDEFLYAFDDETVNESFYKAVNIMFSNTELTAYGAYKSVMYVFTQCGKEPEAIRQCLLLKSASILKNPKSESDLLKAACIAQVFDSVTCYGEIGWATLGRGIYEFFQNFS